MITDGSYYVYVLVTAHVSRATPDARRPRRGACGPERSPATPPGGGRAAELRETPSARHALCRVRTAAPSPRAARAVASCAGVVATNHIYAAH